MDTIFCPSCRLEQSVDHRYCVRCGTDLPTHLVEARPTKTARFFAGVKVADDDPENGYLKVSYYRHHQQLGDTETTMNISGHHVRFSVWVDNKARCVLSLPVSEARLVSEFLDDELRGVDDTLVAHVTRG